MVAPEDSIPAILCLHAFLPGAEEFLQLHKISRHQAPLITILVVYLQVMEAEYHAQFLFLGSSVTDTVVQAGGGHFTNGGHVFDTGITNHFLQEFVDMTSVCIKTAAIADIVIFKNLRLGNQVYHIEAETLDALGLPEPQNILQFLADFGVFPVQICLSHIEQVQIPLAQSMHIFPGRTAKLGCPVRGDLIGSAFLKDIVVLVFFVTGQSLLEPLVFGGSVVEDHVKHKANISLIGFGDELFQFFHSAEAGIYSAVIRHIIAVVPLRAGEEGGAPQHLHAQLLKIIQLGSDAFQVAFAIAIGIAETFGVDLIYNFVLEVCHNLFSL